MIMEEVQIYIFLGFLEAGKTTFLKGALAHKDMQTGEKTALYVFEEGEEEYDEEDLPNVDIHYLSKDDLNEKKLLALQNANNYERIFIEYNGMWEIGDLFDVMPENWNIYQIMAIFDCTTVFNYNGNMRQLVFDKLQYADLITFNRYKSSEDKLPYHKLVKSISRNNVIVFENENHTVEEDDIVDPLPFDMTAPIVNIEDRDYAYFYRELTENLKIFNGKTVRFLCVTAYDKSLEPGTVVLGRHIMTCCEADTKYCALVCRYKSNHQFRTGEWFYVTAQIVIAKHKLYHGEGPVLLAKKFERADAPSPNDIVCTFY